MDLALKRTRNRSRSGAHARCPECGKKLRGEKGLAAHRLQEHGVKPQAKGEK